MHFHIIIYAVVLLIFTCTAAVHSLAQTVQGQDAQQGACGPKGCPIDQQGTQVRQSFYEDPTFGTRQDGGKNQPLAPAGAPPAASAPVPERPAAAKNTVPSPATGKTPGKTQAPAGALLSDFSPVPAPALAGDHAASLQRVMPEVSSQVELSSSDINRIICPTQIKDIVYSKEKGITVKLSGSNAFVKFLVHRKDGRDQYSSVPTELFVVCGDDIYNLIAVPKRIPSQTVQLAPGRVDALKKNIAVYGDLPLEKKVVTILRQIYTDKVPDSITSQSVNRKYELFRHLNLIHVKTFTVDGEGLIVKEFRATVSDDAKGVYLREKDFVRPEIASRIIAVSIDTLDLKKDDMARIFVVERHLGAL